MRSQVSKASRRRRLVAGILGLVGVTRVRSDSLVVDVPPLAQRCFFEDLPPDREVTFDVFVASGSTLDVRLRIDGPFRMDAAGLPFLANAVNTPVIAETNAEQKDLKALKDPKATKGARAVLDDAYSVTFKAAGGAYRICVDNSVGGAGPRRLQVDIHVGREEVGESTYQLRSPLTVPDASGVTPDLEGVAQTLSSMEDLMVRLLRKQQRERHRLAVHAALNTASRERMYRGSMMETAIYVLFSVFQILFIRYWFSGRNQRMAKAPGSWA